MEETKKQPRVVVIGLDGGTYTILEPMMREGKLPNLKALADAGAKGILRTVIPPVTPAAWSTFMTGKNPGKHGVLEFQIKDGDLESPVSSSLRKGKTVWRILSDAGKKVVSMSVPTTYPPEPIDGFMVSSFLTPPGRKDYGYPLELLKEIEDKFGPYRLYIGEVYAPGRVDKVLDEVEEDVRYKFEVAEFLKHKIDWSLFVLHVFGTDRLQHELWHLVDPKHPLHDKQEASQYAERFWKFYEKVDAEIGKFVADLREDDRIFIISDHGFGPVYKFLNFNVWLLQKGYLKLKRGLWTQFKYLLFKLGFVPKNAYRLAMKLGLAKLRLSIGVSSRVGFFNIVDRIILSLRDVDWKRSIAFSKGYYGQIFVNVKGKNEDGCVEPEDYAATVEKIIKDLGEITDGPGGKKILGSIFRKNDIYTGPFTENAPDISFLPADMTYKAIGTAAFTSNKFIEPSYANSADHRMEGILMAKGPGIKRAHDVEAWIGDMAPTMLYLLDEPVPDDMDGKVIADIIEADHLAKNPVRTTVAAGDGEEHSSDYSESEKDEVRKRLKDMGYIG